MERFTNLPREPTRRGSSFSPGDMNVNPTMDSRWSDMIVDLQTVQRELEGKCIADQADVEKTALRLFEQSPLQAREFLTRYSNQQADLVLSRWRKLGEFLIWKYMDGNVHLLKGKGDDAKHQHPRYPEDWYRRIVKEKGDFIKVPKEEAKP